MGDGCLFRPQAALGEDELGEVTRRHKVHHEDEELRVLEGVPGSRNGPDLKGRRF